MPHMTYKSTDQKRQEIAMTQHSAETGYRHLVNGVVSEKALEWFHRPPYDIKIPLINKQEEVKDYAEI